MAISILRSQIHIIDMQTRIPFKFGITTMTSVPHLILKLTMEIDGKQITGLAADHLPPKWFTKDPDTTMRADQEDMITIIQNACNIALACKPEESVFTMWYSIYMNQQSWAETTAFPSLLWGFGVSLVERALIDGFCKRTGINFSTAIQTNAFGIKFDRLYPELTGIEPVDIIPSKPVDRLHVRHTIGLGDPITDSDILPADRVADGLPQSLESIIKTYNIRYFKIKISGDIEKDTARIEHIAEVLQKFDIDHAFTLDGNENYHEIDSFKQFWNNLISNSRLTSFLSRLIFVEQPIHRNMALTENLRDELNKWPNHPPIIIDESDGGFGDLKKAVDIGYVGTSYKNCKGVIKGLTNIAFLKFLSQNHPGRNYILSSEDLSTVGPISLLQDLAVLATLGVRHSERNGHHYFSGMSMLPEPMQRDIMKSHPDLFKWHKDGFPTLDIRNGEIQLGSIVNAPYGLGCDIDPTYFTDLDQWLLKLRDGD